jgi:hypothetical protein
MSELIRNYEPYRRSVGPLERGISPLQAGTYTGQRKERIRPWPKRNLNRKKIQQAKMFRVSYRTTIRPQRRTLKQLINS